jgi:hypothetical protein
LATVIDLADVSSLRIDPPFPKKILNIVAGSSPKARSIFMRSTSGR